MERILTAQGASPQFITASVVSHAIARASVLTEVLVHTGQHFDANMSDVFFEEFGMAISQHNFDIHGDPHGAMTGCVLGAVEQVMLQEKPGAVLVYGDTNSTLAGALAAAKLHIPVVHVEAGPRSFDMAMHGEVNRILTDRISRWLFTPTDTATQNLRREGVAPEQIIEVMDDLTLHYGSRVQAEGGAPAQLGLPVKGYVLVTFDCAKNTDYLQRPTAIVDAISSQSASHQAPEYHVCTMPADRVLDRGTKN